MMEAYMDESYPKEGSSPYASVAGYLFVSKQAQVMSGQWATFLKDKGLKYFRMSECASGNGQFKGWPVEARDKVARSLISRVKKHSSFGFAAVIDHAKHEEVFGRHAEMPSAYTMACFSALNIIRRWADRNKYTGDIAYVFEAGSLGWGEASAYLSDLFRSSRKASQYRCASLSFVSKEKAPLLQAADLIAWHTTKAYVNELEGRPLRKDFQALIRPGDRLMEYNPREIEKLRIHLREGGYLRLAPEMQ